MILETESLLVREFRETDLDDFAALTGDAESMRFMGDGSVLTREQTAGWIETTAVNAALDGWTTWAVVARETGVFVGFAGLVHAGEPGAIEVIYAIGPAHRGRGLASDIVAALRDHAFAERRLTELFATIDPRNLASQRVVEKCGFIEIGRRVDRHGQAEILYRAH